MMPTIENLSYVNPAMLTHIKIHDTSYTYVTWIWRRHFVSNDDLRYQVVGTFANGHTYNFGCFAYLDPAKALAAGLAQQYGLIRELV